MARTLDRSRSTPITVAVAVILLGAFALAGTLSTQVVAGTTRARLAPTLREAASLLERIAGAPTPALDCLVATPADAWVGCEAVCRHSAADEACRFHPPTATVYYDPAAPRAPDGATRTSLVVKSGRLYDLQLTLAFGRGATARRASHFVTLRTALFR